MKIRNMKLEFGSQLDEFSNRLTQAEDIFGRTNHQMDMIQLDTLKLRNELHETDFVINKIQPLHNFTQLMTVLRSVLNEEMQIKELQKLNKQFFIQELGSEESNPELKQFLEPTDKPVEIEESESSGLSSFSSISKDQGVV